MIKKFPLGHIKSRTAAFTKKGDEKEEILFHLFISKKFLKKN